MSIKKDFDRLRDPNNWLLPDDGSGHQTRWPWRSPGARSLSWRGQTLALVGAVAAVATVAVVPAVVSHHGTESTAPASSSTPTKPIPWEALTAPTVAHPKSQALPAEACSPNKLGISIRPGLNPAMGTDYVMLTVKNSGDVDCKMRDSALDGLSWGNGHHPEASADTGHTALLRAGSSNEYRLGFDSSCLASAADASTIETKAEINGAGVSVASGGIPAALGGCDATVISAVTSATPHASSGSAGDQASPFQDLRADVGVPAVVTAGTLDYTVKLTYSGETSFDFTSDCPSYTQRITYPGGDPVDQHYQLNCDAAGSLAPGASAVFAMRVDIPSAAISVGNIKLLWLMDDDGPDAGVLLGTAPAGQ